MLADHGAMSKIIAGGQSLVPSMNFRLARPETLIDINAISELEGIRDTGDTLEIGALTRHAAFHALVCDGPTGQMLTRAVRHVAHYPIRQRGTFGGSLAHADPAAEWCLIAATLDAEIEIAGQDGTRRIPAEAFFRGTFTTALAPEEVLIRIHMPKLPADWGVGFHEFSRRHGDFALAMSAAALRVERGAIVEVRVGLGAVGGTPLRLGLVEAQLTGAPAEPDVLAEAAAEVPGMIDPASDIHGSADFRRELAATMVARALQEALDGALVGDGR